MTWQQLRTIVGRSVTSRPQHDRDLEDELAFHLAEEVRLQEGRGAPPDLARGRARQLFGSTARIKEQTRDVWAWSAIEQLFQDLKFGGRILTRSPGLSLTAVALVALVVGGNTTIFSIVHSVLRKPAAGVHAVGLATMRWVGERESEPWISYPSYREFARATQTFESVAADRGQRLTITHENGTFAVTAGLVSPNYFDTLGVRMLKGRTFSVDDDERAGSGLVAIVSARAWQSLLGGTEDVVGQPLVVDGHPATIVGVSEFGFRGALLAQTADLWLPIQPFTRAAGRGEMLNDRTTPSVSLLGRMRPGVSIDEARSEAGAFWRAVPSTTFPTDHPLRGTVAPYAAMADGSSLLSQRGDVFLELLGVVSLLTLCVVCANVANLLIARGLVRQRETALRQSLGASRLRIVRMLLAEGAVIAGVASAVSFLFAWWVARIATGFVAPSTNGETIILPDFMPDWVVAGYAVTLAGVAVLAFTIAPAMRVWRLPLLATLRMGEASVVRSRSRLSTALVIVQLALCVLLLTAAALAYRSTALVADQARRVDVDRRLLVTINSSGSVSASIEENAILLQRLNERLSSVAGVEHVAFGRSAPLNGWRDEVVTVPPDAAPTRVFTNQVSADFLDTLGVPIVAGQNLPRSRRSAALPAAVINEALADALWPGASPIGRRLPLGSDRREVEVIGVMPTVALSQTWRDTTPKYVLVSASDTPIALGESTFVIPFSGAVEQLAPLVRRAVREVSERTPIVFLRTMRGQQEALAWPARFIARLLMMFAAASLLIATIGQDATALFDTRRRTQEFGLRVALGASARHILLSVVREGCVVAMSGIAIGFGLSLMVARAMRSLLVGVTPTDPATYTAVFAILATASVVAYYVPARRATEVDPVIALRHD